MEIDGIGLFSSDGFKHCWHAGVELGFQPHFDNLRSRSDESERFAILKHMQGNFCE